MFSCMDFVWKCDVSNPPLINFYVQQVTSAHVSAFLFVLEQVVWTGSKLSLVGNFLIFMSLTFVTVN